MDRTNLVVQPDLFFFDVHTSKIQKKDTEETGIYDAIFVSSDPKSEIIKVANILTDYYEKIISLIMDYENVLQRAVYIGIVFPILHGRKIGTYRPCFPRLRYSFRARVQIGR